MFASASRKAAEAAHLAAEKFARLGRQWAGNIRRVSERIAESPQVYRDEDAELGRMAGRAADAGPNPATTASGPATKEPPGPSPDVDAQIARTGWATDPMTVRSHRTDAGLVIPPRTLLEAVATAPDEPWIFRTRAGLTELFRKNIRSGVRLDRLEPIQPINPNFNCHGFTFSRAGSAAWLPGRAVDDILSHNGFRQVAEAGSAVPGDVVVYRNARSEVTHSGVVARVASDDVYVLSKQGPLSVVEHRMHEVTDMYGRDVSIYHTDRPDGRFLAPVPGTECSTPPWPPAAADGEP